MLRVDLVLDVSDYQQDDITTKSLALTSRQASIVATLLALGDLRQAWEPISDAAWDDLSSTLAFAAEEIQSAI